jgi:hypothetical protein
MIFYFSEAFVMIVLHSLSVIESMFLSILWEGFVMMIFNYSVCNSTGVCIYSGGEEFLTIVFNSDCPFIHFVGSNL